MWCSARRRASAPTSTSPPSTAPTASSSAAWRPIDYSGVSVASAGDVNGDGFADLIVGAPGADPHGSDSGASYVVFGKAAGFGANLDLSTLDGANGFKLSGVAADDCSGSSVASAGDVNGDGFADLIVGAPGADPHGANSGASYVVFGKAAGFGANLDLSTLDGANGFKLSGVAAGDRSGCSVASAGDVNGDGFADLIVGARRRRSARQQFRGELCGVRQGRGLRRQSRPLHPRRQPTASSSAAWRQATTAAARSPRPATSTATASPT